METIISPITDKPVVFFDQRGPTCGLQALSFILEYLYGISIPATSGQNDAQRASDTSLRKQFKNAGKTCIGELYDADEEMADYITRSLLDSKGQCLSTGCSRENIEQALKNNSVVMVPFCVNPDGQPCPSGTSAHWCVVLPPLQRIAERENQWGINTNARYDKATVLHWGHLHQFGWKDLMDSNGCIRGVEASWWGKLKDIGNLYYVSCPSETTKNVKIGDRIYEIKPGSIRNIPAHSLQSTLAGKILIFQETLFQDERRRRHCHL